MSLRYRTMIASSQISLFQDSSRQVSAFDSSQLRIRQSAAPVPEGQTNRGTELSLFRQAAYRYSSQEQMAFSSTSDVTGDNRAATFTSSELVEKSSELFLMGQQALTVGRAALGSEAAAESPKSLSVSAGRYMFYSESETRSFASTGSITLDNGETIDFTLSLRQSQSRSYEYSELIQIQERPLTDPLVINFGASDRSQAAAESPKSLSVSAGRYMFYSESETRSFASTGSITLDNGETIDFTLSLRQSQSRSYEYSELIQIQERPLTDPLVINFGA